MKSKSIRALVAFSLGALLPACSDRTHLPVDAHPTQPELRITAPTGK